MAAAISVRALRMQYGPLRAVDGIAFDVHDGEIFALLGPNGAGKTTTIEILEGHRRRSGGEVRVLGVDPGCGGRRYRERIGVMLQGAGVDAELTVVETVRLYAGLYRRPRRVDDTLGLVGLADQAGTRVGALSGGLERRLDLGLALIGDPDIVFLDEPTTGFDPSARRSAWRMLTDLRSLGKTVLLTSHYMDEVERLADRVAVMREGRIVAESTPRTLGGRDVAQADISFALDSMLAEADLPSGPWRDVRRDGQLVVLTTDEPTRALSVLTTWAVDRGEELVALTVTRPSLEDAYLRLTEAPDAAAS